MQKSDSIAALAEALSKAQGEFGMVKKDCKNPFFNSKYADLAGVIDAVKPSLAKHGLSVSQLTALGESGPIVTTLLMHSSGEWLSSDMEVPAAKRDAQGLGSALTYGRRYALSALLNVAAEDDDDGNRATWDGPQKPAKVAKPKDTENASLITDGQRKRLFAIAHEHGWSQEELRQVLGKHGFEASGEITKFAYDGIVTELEGRQVSA